jgi:hypothetical protein
MAQNWRVSDPATCNEDNVETLEEALALANEYMREHRKEAHQDGEWPGEVDQLKIYHATHSAQITHRGEGGRVDYSVQLLDPINMTELYLARKRDVQRVVQFLEPVLLKKAQAADDADRERVTISLDQMYSVLNVFTFIQMLDKYEKGGEI